MPAGATPFAAAVDLVAAIPKALILTPGMPATLIPTGIAIYLGVASVAALLLPRSGLGHKKGLVLGNLVGLIDGDYQGQVMISAWNRGEEYIEIKPYERIAQMVVVPVIQPQFELVDEFRTVTYRGEGGFGSSGS